MASNPANGAGAACQLEIGKPSCADGLTCDQTSAADGSCEYYCSSARACPAGYDCRTTNVASATGPAIDICRPSALQQGDDGGGFVVSGDDSSDSGVDLDALGIMPVDAAYDAPPAQM